MIGQNLTSKLKIWVLIIACKWEFDFRIWPLSALMSKTKRQISDLCINVEFDVRYLQWKVCITRYAGMKKRKKYWAGDMKQGLSDPLFSCSTTWATWCSSTWFWLFPPKTKIRRMTCSKHRRCWFWPALGSGTGCTSASTCRTGKRAGPTLSRRGTGRPSSPEEKFRTSNLKTT